VNQEPLWRCDDGVFADEMTDGIFLLSEEGEIFVIDDPVGKYLWNQLASEMCTASVLVERVRESFPAGNCDVEGDVTHFIQELAQSKLITCDGQ